jgi:hypothetical protein
MLRSTASKVMWVGRATVLFVGLVVILALVFGVATTALAGTGVGAVFNLGKTNTVDAISKLVGSKTNSMLMVDNNGAGTALDLRVGSSTTPAADKTVAPMKVDSQKVVLTQLVGPTLGARSASTTTTLTWLRSPASSSSTANTEGYFVALGPGYAASALPHALIRRSAMGRPSSRPPHEPPPSR